MLMRRGALDHDKPLVRKDVNGPIEKGCFDARNPREWTNKAIIRCVW